MTIEHYVNAIKAGTYDVSTLDSPERLLETYQGHTLYEYMASHPQYLHLFNQTFTRFADLMTQRQPDPDTQAVYALVMMAGFAQMVHTIIQKESDDTIDAMIRDPMAHFSFLSPGTQILLMQFLDGFMPEIKIPQMLRHAQALRQIASDEQSEGALQGEAITVDRLMILHTLYQSAQPSLRKSIGALLDRLIKTHAQDEAALSIILSAVVPAPLGLFDQIPHSHIPPILSTLSPAATAILMRSGHLLLKDPKAKLFYKHLLSLNKDPSDLVLAREDHTTDAEWDAACLVASFIALGQVPQVKTLTIKMAGCPDYANEQLRSLVSSPKVIFCPKEARSSFIGHAPGIAYLNHFSANRPLFYLDVTHVPSMIISTLINQLLGHGLRNLRLTARVTQPSSTLFTDPQETFIKKHIEDATLHYVIIMRHQKAARFDMIVKPTGLFPGPMTLASTANKYAFVHYLVNALPRLLSSPSGTLFVDTNSANPSLLEIHPKRNAQELSSIQETLRENPSATPVWILFAVPDAQDKSNRHLYDMHTYQYLFDIHVYHDRIEPGLMTRLGCGSLPELKLHIPTVTEPKMTTEQPFLSASRTTPVPLETVPAPAVTTAPKAVRPLVY